MKTKQKKNAVAIMLGIILILCISIVGVIVCRNTDLSASADTNTDSVENINVPQFDVIDYQGNKIYATYEFVRLNENDCSVQITNKNVATVAEIPSVGYIDGKMYNVTEIAANGFASSSHLIKVKIASSIKKINNMAFANCSQLKYMDLRIVEELGNSVFYRCSKLERVVIPKSVKSVGSYLFRNNNTQVEVRATESSCVGWNNLWNSSNKNQEVHYNSTYTTNAQVEYIYNELGRSSNSIKGFMISYGQPDIGEFEFLDVEELIKDKTDIIIPKEYTFISDDNEEVTYPILAIAGDAFAYSKLTSLIIEYSDEPIEIGSTAFAGINSGFTVNDEQITVDIIINRQVKYFDYEENFESNSVFWDSRVKNIILPEGSNIVTNMFNGCNWLENIYFKTPQYYGEDDNYEATELNNVLNSLITSDNGIVNITEKIENIGAGAFNGATAIKELHLSSKIKNVGATILANWDKGKQKVFLHNESPIKYKTDEDPEGWHTQWNSSFKVKCDYYDIKFDTGELQYNILDMHIKSGEKIGALPNFDAGQYKELRGWYLDSELITEETIYNFDADIVVSAKVSEFCNIVFDTNNGTGEKNTIKRYLEDEMPTIVAPKAEHRTFIGYYDDDKGEGNLYFDKNMNCDREILAGEIKLYAIYKPITYNIYYDLTGISYCPDIQLSVSNDSRNKLSITYFETVTLYDAYSEDFVFAGWYLNGKRVDILKEIDRNITLTAKWRGLYVNPAPNGTLNDDSPTVVFGFSRIIMGATYRINIGPNVKELYILANVRKPVDVTMSIVVLDKIVGPGGLILGKRTSDLKLTIRNINIKAISGSHAIVMDSEKSLQLYSYDSSITGSDTLSPKNLSLGTQQGSSAIYCKHLVLNTSVMLMGGSNTSMSTKPFVGGVAVSLVAGGDITMKSGNIKIIGGNNYGLMGVAGYAVYADNKNYNINILKDYSNIIINNGTGNQPTTPPYIGY